ncbi:MAG TPA: hypothetical protein VMS88_00025 [Terriglobales bacterium]|nr:hypothetical protein [Terriglobales bacterium]
MKDRVRRVEYFAITIEDRPGAGASLGRRLAEQKVNLLAVLAFPVGPGRTQVDLVPENPGAFRAAASRLGIDPGPAKTAFLVQGTDKPGAMGELMTRLGDANINVRATAGVVCGGRRFGSLIWVAPQDVDEASLALGASLLAINPV